MRSQRSTIYNSRSFKSYQKYFIDELGDDLPKEYVFIATPYRMDTEDAGRE